MDILIIATREGNRAYSEAEGGAEAKAKAYHKTYRETLKRGKRAEQILETGRIERVNGYFHVPSQSSDDYYVVNLEVRECACPDHQQRETYCKHLQAAELFQENSEDVIDANGESVVLEVEGYARGRQFLEKKLKRVRVNGGSYRKAKTEDLDEALEWLKAHGYQFDKVVGPGHSMGTGTARYFYNA